MRSIFLVLAFCVCSFGAVLSWSVTASSDTAYQLSGSLGISSANNPSLNVNVGDVLVFVVNAPTHPFAIHTVAGDITTASRYNSGVSGSQGLVSGILNLTITSGTPRTLYYQCEAHTSMNGRIAVADASVAGMSVLVLLFSVFFFSR